MPCAELSPTDRLSCDAGGPATWGRSHGGGRGGACPRAVARSCPIGELLPGLSLGFNKTWRSRLGDLPKRRSGYAIDYPQSGLATNNAYLISFGGADDTIDKVEAEKKF
jgi:hypothetical protein